MVRRTQILHLPRCPITVYVFHIEHMIHTYNFSGHPVRVFVNPLAEYHEMHHTMHVQYTYLRFGLRVHDIRENHIFLEMGTLPLVMMPRLS